ncbi:MAG: nucleoside-diphosphate kinase [Candidatus Paceibacterota bacterium]
MKDPKQEKTVLLIKPDGVKRGLIGEIVSRVEEHGLKITAMEMIQATPDQVDEHYPKDDKWIKRLGENTFRSFNEYGLDVEEGMGTTDKEEIGKEVRSWLIDYLTAGPMVKMIVQGNHAISMIRKIAGSSLPSEAENGTIRGDLSVDSAAAANSDQRAIHNIVHASEDEEEAEHELKFWFSPEEIHDYERVEEKVMF